jgi:cysteine desulfurase family protein
MAIYLDNGATSYPKPESVPNAIMDFMNNNGASPGRGNYMRAREAERLVYETRKALCQLLKVKRPGRIVFTANATDAINIALKGFLNEGDKVLTTAYEHNAMWRPLKSLELTRGITMKQIPCTPDGLMDLEWFEAEIKQGINLVAVSHASNVIGCITPLKRIVSIAHAHDVPVLVDAAQTAGVYPIDVTEDTPVDMMAFTGHKGLLGPSGTGGLYLREGLELRTFREGGTGSMSSSPYQPDESPDRYEAGTLNMIGLAGLRASVGFLLDVGVENVRAHEIRLMELLMAGLSQIPKLTFYGPLSAQERLGLISFNLEGHDPNKLAMQLDTDYGIMVRSGAHCAPQAHRLLGTEQAGTVRASLGFFNTEKDIEKLLAALQEIAGQS